MDSALHTSFVRTNLDEGEVLHQGRLNNAPHKANLAEQKQSISNLQSWQITTCAAKAKWHLHHLEGGDLYFKMIQHGRYLEGGEMSLLPILKLFRSYQNRQKLLKTCKS